MKKRHLKKSFNLNPFLVLGIITLGVIGWYSWPRKITPIAINYVGDAAGTVTLTLTPGSVTLTPNTESVLTLTMNTTTSNVTGAQIEIIYEPTKIGTPIVTLGDFLPNVLAPVKIENGRISFVVAAPPDSKGKIGYGNLATIKIKPPVAGTSSLTFGEMNGIFALGSQSNVLKLASDATITVNVNKPSKPTNLRSNCSSDSKKITLRWDAVDDATSYKLRLDQKDGDTYKSLDNISSTEHDFDIIPGDKYAWWVHTTKSGVDSDEAKVDEVVCAKLSPSSTPAPTAPPKPTIKATAKPTATPKSTATPKPTSSITPSPTSIPSPTVKPSPTSAGSLNDIFTDKDLMTASPKPSAKPGLFSMIALGWKALFDNLANLFK